MKKVLIINLILVLFLCSCQKEEDIPNKKEKPQPIIEEKIEKNYNDNPIKLALYEYSNGNFNKKEEYNKEFVPMTDIAVFSVLYTNQEIIEGYDYNNLWNNYYGLYQNIDEFKIGYQIYFSLEDGTVIDETILKPKNVFDYTFSNYLYIWLYDDINQTASWYSHLEENDYNEKTIMTSIKLMATDKGVLITTPIKLTVFTYKDELDFNSNGQYIGESKFTTNINLIK